MPIEQFTVQQFESALPRDRSTRRPLWLGVGYIDGEQCYLLPVTNNRHTDRVAIMVRSSIGHEGVSAACGEDSIRCYTVEVLRSAGRGNAPVVVPLGSKTQKYVTRVKGWEARLHDVLRTLYKLALMCKPCPRNGCQNIMGVVKIKKWENAGKHAVCCRDHFKETFHVIELTIKPKKETTAA